MIIIVCDTFRIGLFVNAGATPYSESSIVSPIRHLAPSIAVSSSRGTIISVHLNSTEIYDGCIVTLSHTPSLPAKKSKLVRKVSVSSQFNPVSDLLPLHTRGPVQFSHERQFIIPHFHIIRPFSYNPLLIVATGYTPDISHLIEYTASTIVRDETNYNSPYSVDAHKISRHVLGNVISQAAFGSSRPYGIELIVVGMDRHRHIGTHGKKRRQVGKLGLYTVDPSGNWIHWGGGGACIGNQAALIRKELYLLLLQEKTHMATMPRWRHALYIAMMASLQVDIQLLVKKFSTKEQINHHLQSIQKKKEKINEYDSMVVFEANPSRCKPIPMSTISRYILEEIFHECMQEIIDFFK